MSIADSISSSRLTPPRADCCRRGSACAAVGRLQALCRRRRMATPTIRPCALARSNHQWSAPGAVRAPGIATCISVLAAGTPAGVVAAEWPPRFLASSRSRPSPSSRSRRSRPARSSNRACLICSSCLRHEADAPRKTCARCRAKCARSKKLGEMRCARLVFVSWKSAG